MAPEPTNAGRAARTRLRCKGHLARTVHEGQRGAVQVVAGKKDGGPCPGVGRVPVEEWFGVPRRVGVPCRSMLVNAAADTGVTDCSCAQLGGEIHGGAGRGE